MTLMNKYHKPSSDDIIAYLNLNLSDITLMISLSFIHTLGIFFFTVMTLCSDEFFCFDTIGVSETWNSTQSEILDNININGYSYYGKKSKS